MNMCQPIARFFSPGIMLSMAVLICSAAPDKLVESKKEAGWKVLLDGASAQGWRGFKKQSLPGQGWIVEEGWLHCLGKGGGDIISEEEYENFELQWEWKQAPRG